MLFDSKLILFFWLGLAWRRSLIVLAKKLKKTKEKPLKKPAMRVKRKMSTNESAAIDSSRERMDAGPHGVARANHCSVRQCLHFFPPIIIAWVYRRHSGAKEQGTVEGLAN